MGQAAKLCDLDVDVVRDALSVEPELDPYGFAGETQNKDKFDARLSAPLATKQNFDFSAALEKVGLSREAVESSVNRASLMKAHWKDVFDLTNGSHLSLMLRLEGHILNDLDRIQRGEFNDPDLEIATRNGISKNSEVYRALGKAITDSLIAAADAELKLKKFKAENDGSNKRSKKPGFGAVHITTQTLNLDTSKNDIEGDADVVDVSDE